MRKPENLRQYVEAMAPVVRELRELERRAAGIARQYDAIGVSFEGPEELLDPLQRKVDRGFEKVIGRKLNSEPYAYGGLIREVLDSIGRLVRITGAKVETDAIPLPDAEPWTRDLSLYDAIPKDDGSPRMVPKWGLAVRPRLNADGTIATRRRPKES